ncbi:hypothetical protein [Aggregatilinea lenta]|uniref:hypothetical protein n=1 Tax=Aggregatilinea lenta TaxID=913108 RepID=UPI0013C36EFA|nr:hypothetical protein [Aggregatilinea lenta]
MAASQSSQSSENNPWNLAFRVLSSDWATLLFQAWELARKIYAERVVGLYEVLDFDHTLELCDVKGMKAIYHKRETIRLLQDYVSAYTDLVWGKGDILADYRCSPGVPVDRYSVGHKRCILISLREVRRRGDSFTVHIERTVRNGFITTTGWSETVVQHRTHRFRTSVLFPAERPPRHIALLEVNRNRTTPLGEAHTEVLPDGRYRVSWETTNPKLFEAYTLKWTW